MTAATSQKLANVLRLAGFELLASRAEADEFHDFFSPLDDPAMALDRALYLIASDGSLDERQRLAAHHIRMRHHDGEFDADLAESEAWAESNEGVTAFEALVRDLGKGKP